MIWVVAGSVVLLVIAYFLRRHAEKRLADLDVAGDVVYWDGDAEDAVLISHAYKLTGKPDYVLQSGAELIPVERKSRTLSAAGPYEGELLQLAAYCVLVEEHFGMPVRHGQLSYQNRSLQVPFDEELRHMLLEAVNELKAAAAMGDVARDHNSPARCRGCGYRSTCQDALPRPLPAWPRPRS